MEKPDREKIKNWYRKLISSAIRLKGVSRGFAMNMMRNHSLDQSIILNDIDYKLISLEEVKKTMGKNKNVVDEYGYRKEKQ